ncbi:Histidine kinase-, DNA gyrase B-, and HSP90-like ATPase [Geodermatophilus saharensis]|uniref:Oxygen sensor histidine kinase NreB n=1 Tax=Geodermatophilus saharensis TaxID=1137994 RepID=A0A239A5H0_9ACTN|nr:histidine kinase [Geodermatophilus saharensis]SNR90294.1 Histidine kinase-, DNA gyrase B-, and HSP90-like ATPase [Geodermatophilus saharensis]
MTAAPGRDLPASLRSTSMPVEAVAEPLPVSAASLDAQLLDLVFDRAPMGVMVFGADLRLQRINKTEVGFFEHYFRVPPGAIAPGAHVYDLLPGSEDVVTPLFEHALAGRVVRQAAVRVDVPGGVTYWDVVFAPLFADGEVVGVVDITTDATDRVLSLQRLEDRITAFTAIAAGMTVDQPLDVTLREVVARVLATTPAVGCSIVSWADDRAPAPVAHVGEGAAPGLGDALARTLTAGWERLVGTPEEPAVTRIERRRGFRARALADPLFEPVWPFWREAAWDDLLVVPLSSSGRTFGELHVALPSAAHLDEDDEAYLVALADQAAVAAQNAALFGSAAQSATVVERQRLARELHDSVSQALFSMTLHARAAERHLAAAGIGAGEPVAEQVSRLRELTAGALAEMRALIFELRPGALAEEGLAAALGKQAAALAARTGVPVDVAVPADRVPVPPDAEEHLYRLALEALNNALRHAGATRLAVELTVSGGELRLAVADDGVGFDPALARPGHLGLSTMRERAAAAGGRLVVRSAPGRGTRVEVTVPLG